MKKIMFFLKIGLCAAVLQWSLSTAAIASGKIKISVSVLPQAYFVEKIGGTRVNVQVMIPKGASPETYSPTPRQLMMLYDSKIYVKVGSPSFPFEKKHFDSILKKHENMIVVNMSAGVKYRKGDPHVWVAPATVKIAAVNIYKALSKIDPLNRSYYKKRLASFLNKIERLDNEIRALLAGKKGFSFMVFHPAWGYFADEYGLNQLSIAVSGKSPSASHIKNMIDIAREKNIRIIFVQKGFDVRSAGVIADAIGGKVLPIDPLAKNWLENMEDIAKILRDVLKQ